VREITVKIDASKIGFWFSFIFFCAWSLFGTVLNNDVIEVSLFEFFIRDLSSFKFAEAIGVSPTLLSFICISVLALFVASTVCVFFGKITGTKTIIIYHDTK